jgi:hypothetical protein
MESSVTTQRSKPCLLKILNFFFAAVTVALCHLRVPLDISRLRWDLNPDG